MATPAAVLSLLVKADGIGLVKTQLHDVDRDLRNTGDSATKAGAAMKKGLMVGAAAVAALGKGFYEIGEAFDDAYDTIRVGTGKTGKQLEGLKKDFKEVVKGVPTDFKSASQAITDLNQRLGLTGKPLQERTKQFLELSRITETDVKTNIQSVTRAFGDWEVKTGQQAGTLDKFFRASQKSGASVQDLAKQVVQFGAPLRQVGFSLDEATAMFASFEKAGVNTSTMMPGLKMALKGFLSEGIDPKKGLEKTFEGIRDGSIKASEAMEIFGQRAGPDMVEAIRQGRFDLDKMTATIANGQDTIRKAGADTMDFSEKWQMFKNRVLVALEPIATRVFDAIGKGMDFISSIDLSGVVGWFRNLGKAFSGAGDSGGVLSDAVDMLGDAFKAAKGVVGAAVDALTAVWNTFGDLIIERAQIIWNTIRDTFGGVIKILQGLADFVAGVFTGDWRRAWDGIKGIFSGVWEAIKAIVKGALDIVHNTIKIVLRAIETVLGAAWETIRSAASTAWGAIKEVILIPIRTARDVLSNVWDTVGETAGHAWRALKETASTVWGNVKEAILTPVRAARDVLGEVWEAIRDRVKGAFEKIVGFASGLGSSVKDAITGAFEGAVNVVIGFINTIIGVINKIPGVEIGKIEKLATGGKMSSRGVETDVQMLARGGMVRKPMAIVGEEAPRHPEFVIPTNPAYRSRAVGLYQQLGKQLGVKDGIGGSSLQDASAPLGSAVSEGLLEILKNGSRGLIGMLPGVGGLPGWLHGMGSAVLGKAIAYIKKQVASVVGRVGDYATLDVITKLGASKFGVSTGHPGSMFRPGDPGWHGKNRARDYVGSAGAMQSFAAFLLGLAPRLLELIHTPLGVGVKNGQVVPVSYFGAKVMADHFDHVHVAMAQGGMLHRNGYVLDSYQAGTPYVPRTGPYMLHKGEQVVPAHQNRGGGDVIVQGNLVVREEADANTVAARLAWMIASAA